MLYLEYGYRWVCPGNIQVIYVDGFAPTWDHYVSLGLPRHCCYMSWGSWGMPRPMIIVRFAPMWNTDSCESWGMPRLHNTYMDCKYCMLLYAMCLDFLTQRNVDGYSTSLPWSITMVSRWLCRYIGWRYVKGLDMGRHNYIVHRPSRIFGLPVLILVVT